MFVERETQAPHAQRWFDEVKQAVHEHQANLFDKHGAPTCDAALLSVMASQWEVVFRKTLGRAERTLFHELRDFRNEWAHQETFASDYFLERSRASLSAWKPCSSHSGL